VEQTERTLANLHLIPQDPAEQKTLSEEIMKSMTEDQAKHEDHLFAMSKASFDLRDSSGLSSLPGAKASHHQEGPGAKEDEHSCLTDVDDWILFHDDGSSKPTCSSVPSKIHGDTFDVKSKGSSLNTSTEW
jgi:hypothetical protein